MDSSSVIMLWSGLTLVCVVVALVLSVRRDSYELTKREAIVRDEDAIEFRGGRITIEFSLGWIREHPDLFATALRGIQEKHSGRRAYVDMKRPGFLILVIEENT